MLPLTEPDYITNDSKTWYQMTDLFPYSHLAHRDEVLENILQRKMYLTLAGFMVGIWIGNVKIYKGLRSLRLTLRVWIYARFVLSFIYT